MSRKLKETDLVGKTIKSVAYTSENKIVFEFEDGSRFNICASRKLNHTTQLDYNCLLLSLMLPE